jgi:hypothetical protein
VMILSALRKYHPATLAASYDAREERLAHDVMTLIHRSLTGNSWLVGALAGDAPRVVRER